MKTGEYTARIEARRAKLLAREQVGVVRPTPNYSDLLIDAKETIEDRVEMEILAKFGGYDAMVKVFEAEKVYARSMTVAEAITYLRALAEKDK